MLTDDEVVVACRLIFLGDHIASHSYDRAIAEAVQRAFIAKNARRSPGVAPESSVPTDEQIRGIADTVYPVISAGQYLSLCIFARAVLAASPAVPQEAREAMQQALDAFDRMTGRKPDFVETAIASLRAVLASTAVPVVPAEREALQALAHVRDLKRQHAKASRAAWGGNGIVVNDAAYNEADRLAGEIARLDPIAWEKVTDALASQVSQGLPIHKQPEPKNGEDGYVCPAGRAQAAMWGDQQAGDVEMPLKLADQIASALESGVLWTEKSEAHPRMQRALADFNAWRANGVPGTYKDVTEGGQE